jgi:queuine/archaeosine tRNA-ribosyltransferase
VERLVALLDRRWPTWWARDIAHGDWETEVRAAILRSAAVVPVFSVHAIGDRTRIIKDEMRFAQQNGKPILPFFIGHADSPLGFGGLDHTSAHGWVGEEGHAGYRELKAKLAATIGNGRRDDGSLARPSRLSVRDKSLTLPAFVFSLSSHETQVTPKEGLELLEFLEPEATLFSAYDAWKYYRHDAAFRASIREFGKSQGVLFLDSGNYEAYRRDDRHMAKKNPTGWRQENYWTVAARYTPDVAFAFDVIVPSGSADQIVDRVIRGFRADERQLLEREFSLCPIVHLPGKTKNEAPHWASQIVARVAAELNPLLIAIPERELGEGLLARVETVRAIRKSLDKLDRYYPLHLLGTGNPLSMGALAAAGADLFDGLEWCRTIADYDRGYLFHFQQFDCFKEARLHRIHDDRIRSIVADREASYAEKALSYNVDFFKDATRTMQTLIHTDQLGILLNMVPNIGPDLLKAIVE